jgi:hypothetical protein
MLISLNTPSFDLSGSVELDVTIDAGNQSRRVNRVATLDGGAVFNDFGFSEADRTIRLDWKSQGAEKEAIVARLVRLYQRLILSCHEGVFNVAPESYKSTSTGSTLTLLVAEKLTT